MCVRARVCVHAIDIGQIAQKQARFIPLKLPLALIPPLTDSSMPSFFEEGEGESFHVPAVCLKTVSWAKTALLFWRGRR